MYSSHSGETVQTENCGDAGPEEGKFQIQKQES